MKILMAAAENDAFSGGKVGGIGDVVRDIPLALASIDQQVDVVIPGYGVFSKLSTAKRVAVLQVMFGGHHHTVEVFKIISDMNNVTQWIIEHALFSQGGEGKIYCDDPDNRPFASDATKFALFSAAVAKAIISDVFGHIDVLHLHDWHTAMVSVLRAFDPEYQQLRTIKTVYTIHNLALQGIRPIADDESSLKAWFPDLSFDLNVINDPRYNHCYNPMRAGIKLADKVHAVSPTYAKEILLPSNAEHGYFGGEGLENDLRAAKNEGRLHGILNGCEYNNLHNAKPLSFNKLLQICENELIKWLGNKPLVDSAHLIATTRIKQLTCDKPKSKPLILTSVGRITDQKIRLFKQTMASGESALENLLGILGNEGIFILLGSGAPSLEHFLTQVAAKHANFIFLKGYSEALSESLYSTGDLFLMPSSFEPCGISQMLSMRAGQPCLAHRVGGLTDTIIHNENGFTFTGNTPNEQVENMLICFKKVLNIKLTQAKQWQKIVKNAVNARFLWQNVAHNYVKYLYSE